MFPFGDNYQLLLVYCHCLSEIIGIGIAICLQSRVLLVTKQIIKSREELIAYVVQSTVYKSFTLFCFSGVLCLVSDFIFFDVYIQYGRLLMVQNSVRTKIQTECGRISFFNLLHLCIVDIVIFI